MSQRLRSPRSCHYLLCTYKPRYAVDQSPIHFSTPTDILHAALTAMTRDPNRRVRFALDGYPSPVSTSSTLSSPGPRTPQQLHQPLAHVHSPSSTSSFSISPNGLALSISSNIHGALDIPPFNFDVSLDPVANPAMRDNLHLQRIRNDPATDPPEPSITLVSRHLPWEIVISASSKSYVTISDVLYGLYRALRLPVSQVEYDRETPEKQKEVARAYYNRFERHVSNPLLMEQEKAKGVKRVDFLTGAHRFKGLSKTERPNVWRLRLKQ